MIITVLSTVFSTYKIFVYIRLKYGHTGALMTRQATEAFPHAAPELGGSTGFLPPDQRPAHYRVPLEALRPTLQHIIEKQSDPFGALFLWENHLKAPPEGTTSRQVFEEGMPAIAGAIPVMTYAQLLQRWGTDAEIKDYEPVVAEKAPESYAEFIRHSYDHAPDENFKEWAVDCARRNIPLIAKTAPQSAIGLIEWVMAKTDAKDLAIDKLGEALPYLAESFGQIGQKWAVDFALRTLVDTNIPFDRRETDRYNPDGFISNSPKSSFCASRLGAATVTERMGIFRMAGYLVHSLAKHSPRLADAISNWSKRNAGEQKSAYFAALWQQVQKDTPLAQIRAA